jgi:hypothetical protein
VYALLKEHLYEYQKCSMESAFTIASERSGSQIVALST